MRMGVGYEYVSVASLSTEAFATINPQGLLPALELDGRIVTQSAAILDLLECRYPERPILPADPFLRAQSIAFRAIIAAEMYALTVSRVRKYLAAAELPPASVDGWIKYWQGQGFASLEALLERRERDWPFSYGDSPGWADLHLVPQVAVARRLGINLAPFPMLLAIAARCSELSAFADARPESQPDFPGTTF